MRSLRIAIADDEPEICADLAETLSEMGHQVVLVATNGKALVDGVKNERPDLVISDLRMPLLDGIQVANRLAEEQPVAFLGFSSDERLFTDSEHVHAFLLKPIEDEPLGRKIEEAVLRFSGSNGR